MTVLNHESPSHLQHAFSGYRRAFHNAIPTPTTAATAVNSISPVLTDPPPTPIVCHGHTRDTVTARFTVLSRPVTP